jgi:hypothetical protein
MKDLDIDTLRSLAEQYMEICGNPIQNERRRLWRMHNSLKKTRPLIYVRAFAWKEMPDSKCVCKDVFFRGCEDFFRRHIFWNSLNDDSIFEPWFTVNAVKKCHGWGVETPLYTSDDPGGAFKVDYPIKELSDIDKLKTPWHEINESATAENAKRLTDAVGDIIPINIDRGPYHRMFAGDLSTDLGYLRGIENIMMDMMDEPEWLHRLVKFMGDGVLKEHDEAEKAGDWGLCDHQNQSMSYAEELQDPAPNKNGINRKQLWYFAASQEFTSVSPEMHEEFLLQYQMPILSKFGLVAYGCCEDLTRKIDMLRKIPNLRRIAVSPFANVAKCAEQIGRDYVLSYRPSPADMVSYDFNPDRIRSIQKKDLEACKDSHVDITLKDVETVGKDLDRVRKWVSITRKVIDEIHG